MRIAVIQMVSSLEVDKSLAQVDRLISGLNDVDAIFLPENFASLGQPDPRKVALAEASGDGPIQTFLSSVAAQTQAWVFAGTVPMLHRPDGELVPESRVRAASMVFNHEGDVVGRYDKVHMFDVDVADQHKHYRESATFEHGDSLQVVDAPWAKIGLSVCYDLRFSELYLHLFKQGAEIFTAPSAFTVPTGKAHFKVLLRNRAIESFAFVIAACQGGQHDSGRETYGHSMVVNPWGEVMAEAGVGEQVLEVELDLTQVAEARSNMPVLDQRRLGID